MASIQVNVADSGSSTQKPVLTILVDGSLGARAINSDGPADDVVTVSSDNASGIATDTKEEVKEILDADRGPDASVTRQEATEPASATIEGSKETVPQEPIESTKEEAKNPFEDSTNEVKDPTLDAPVLEPAHTSEDAPSVRRASVFKEIEVETNKVDGSTTVTVIEPPVIVPGDEQPRRTVTTVKLESPQDGDAATLNDATPEDAKVKARAVDRARAHYPDWFLTLLFGHALKDEIKQKLIEQSAMAPAVKSV